MRNPRLRPSGPGVWDSGGRCRDPRGHRPRRTFGTLPRHHRSQRGWEIDVAQPLERPPSTELGTVEVEGRQVNAIGPARRARLGVGRTFQTSSLFDTLSVFENARLSAEARLGGALRSLAPTVAEGPGERRCAPCTRTRRLGQCGGASECFAVPRREAEAQGLGENSRDSSVVPRDYARVVRLYLLRYLGKVVLVRLTPNDVNAMMMGAYGKEGLFHPPREMARATLRPPALRMAEQDGLVARTSRPSLKVRKWISAKVETDARTSTTIP